jgi:hypothetical protein
MGCSLDRSKWWTRTALFSFTGWQSSQWTAEHRAIHLARVQQTAGAPASLADSVNGGEDGASKDSRHRIRQSAMQFFHATYDVQRSKPQRTTIVKALALIAVIAASCCSTFIANTEDVLPGAASYLFL